MIRKLPRLYDVNLYLWDTETKDLDLRRRVYDGRAIFIPCPRIVGVGPLASID